MTTVKWRPHCAAAGMLIAWVAFWYAAIVIVCTVAKGAEIQGPKEVKNGYTVTFAVGGIPKENLHDTNFVLFPDKKAQLWFVAREFGGAGRPICIFQSFKPGTYAVLVDVNVPGSYELLKHEFVVGGQDDEDEDEDEDDEEDPIPGPVAKLLVLIVEDSRSNRTNQNAAVLSSSAWRQWLEQNGHRHRLTSLNAKDETFDPKDKTSGVPMDLAPFLKVARETGGDCVFLVDDDTDKSMLQFPLPTSSTKLLKKIKEFMDQ